MTKIKYLTMLTKMRMVLKITNRDDDDDDDDDEP